MNISSIVVKCAPEYIDEVAAAIEASGQGELYAKDTLGRMIVILEGETTEEESEKLRIIQAIDHVLSAEMVYAYSDEEYAAETAKFERVSDALIDQLNSDEDAQNIVYHGHIKDK